MNRERQLFSGEFEKNLHVDCEVGERHERRAPWWNSTIASILKISEWDRLWAGGRKKLAH